MERETPDPNGGDWFTQNAPAPTGDPWTPDELAASQQWANTYYTTHQIPASWGTPDDLANAYLQQRRNGVSHQAAMDAVPGLLGWDKYQAPGATPPPAPKDTVVAPPTTTTTVVPPPADTTTDPNAGTGSLPSGFGAAPAPYVSDPNAPASTPLAPYVRPQWTGGDYVAPTEAELYASPGYQARLDKRLQGSARRFAAQGTILNGGTLTALDRQAQDYATNEYQTLRNNTFENYKQRYAQFSDDAGRDLQSRTVAATENQNNFLNRTSSYLSGNARTLSDYLTNLTAKRNSEMDLWNRLQDLNSTGANLAGGSR